jgi:hypothetical protein
MVTATEFVKSREVREMTATLTFADTTGAELFKLPSGARVIDWIVNVQTAFSGGTTQLNVGTTAASANEILAALTVSSAGKTAITTTLTLSGYETTAVTPIYGVVGASNTAGEADVTCLFSLQTGRRI